MPVGPLYQDLDPYLTLSQDQRASLATTDARLGRAADAAEDLGTSVIW